MCLIIVNPSGVALPEDHLDNGWQRNSDGGGYMFARSGKLVIRKSFNELAIMKQRLFADRLATPDSAFVVHFRYATHGETTKENCHPHSICGGNIGLAHNGILDDFLPPFCADYSDTVHFCRTVLAYRRPQDVMSKEFRSMLASMIGTGNKFAMLSATGDLSIVNENRGLWHGGNWYSNDGYKARPPVQRLTYARDSLFYRGKHWDDMTEDEWRSNRAADPQAELDAMDVLINQVGWPGLSAQEQDHYIKLYEALEGAIH